MSVEHPDFQVCIETPGPESGISTRESLVLRAEAVPSFGSSSCSWGAVKCINQGDPAHPRIEVDYQVFVSHPNGGTRSEQLQSACSFDISRIPTWCLAAPSLGGTTEVQLKSRYGTWSVPIPNKLSAAELCFGPKASK
ncbi:MAG TPA: hypothetical protein VGC79_16145 [Polyangiaceae bacterium]